MTNRQELIARAERGVVPVEHWSDRDSAGAQKQLGEARALLVAGCKFGPAGNPEDDANVHWVTICYPGFHAFEEGQDDVTTWDDGLFYIPTSARLDRAAGKDWY